MYDANGMSVPLGEEVGSGGEGAVYTVQNRPELVAKVYHAAVDSTKAAKLLAMAQASSRDLLRVAAWPVDVLRLTRDGRIGGLLMPRIHHAREAHIVYGPKHRQAEFPQADWSFLIWVARNAAAAVDTVHRAGHVIGDVNQKCFLVANDATVKVIDCDSFQITRNGRRFPCMVGVPEFTPPELHGKQFEIVERSANHDGFGLAVLIFHLLFMGRHPFVGRFQGHGDMPLERAIRELRFAYSQTAATKQVVPPPHALPLSASSFPVASLFERAFGPAGLRGHRPTANEWVHALESLAKDLTKCAADSGHKYLKTLPRCPWCEIERSGGPAFFLTVAPTVGAANRSFDFQSIWAAISHTAPPAFALPNASPALLPQVTPKPGPAAPTRRRAMGTLCYLLASAAVVLAFNAAVPGPFIVTVIVLAIAGARLRRNPAWEAERALRKAALESAEKQWKGLVDAAQREARAAAEAFLTKQRELEGLAGEYRQLHERARKEKDSLHRRREELQKRAFLDRHYVRDAKLPRMGSELKAALISEGFETAADIEARVIKVAGIGQARCAALMAWRTAVEQRFRYDPTAGINPADVKAIDHKIMIRRTEIERGLLRGKAELDHVRRRAEQSDTRLQERAADAARQLAQARADLGVM
jgi:DNA-binding helix-hairpin-helix protein with protein kinase domain